MLWQIRGFSNIQDFAVTQVLQFAVLLGLRIMLIFVYSLAYQTELFMHVKIDFCSV